MIAHLTVVVGGGAGPVIARRRCTGRLVCMADEVGENDLAGIRARFLPGWYGSLDVGPGWYRLIVDLDRELAAIDPDYQLAQVKEKFGGLRYYVEFESDRPRPGFDDLIRAAERRSERTCEQCGGGGGLTRRGSWVRTLCATDAAASGFAPDKSAPA